MYIDSSSGEREAPGRPIEHGVSTGFNTTVILQELLSGETLK